MQSAALPAAAPAAPERRRFVRVPRRVEQAITPLDRFCALYGGVEKAAARLCRAPSTLYNWRQPEGKDGWNGFFPQTAIEEARRAAEEDGWDLPHGFLTEAGRFSAPKRKGGA